MAHSGHLIRKVLTGPHNSVASNFASACDQLLWLFIACRSAVQTTRLSMTMTHRDMVQPFLPSPVPHVVAQERSNEHAGKWTANC